MIFLNILAEVMPNSVGDYELIRLYVDYLILICPDFSGERKKHYLECAFEKLRRIPFGEHHESDFILWDRLMIKVIESDKKIRGVIFWVILNFCVMELLSICPS